jgi:hypothetical protein
MPEAHQPLPKSAPRVTSAAARCRFGIQDHCSLLPSRRIFLTINPKRSAAGHACPAVVRRSIEARHAVSIRWSSG